MTQLALESDSLRVSVWIERPTPVVAAEFRAAFTPNRQRAAEQDERFRRAQWQKMNESIFVRLNGDPLEIELEPLSLLNNGRGDAQKFVYAVGGAVPLAVVGTSTRLVVELDNQVLLDQEHVFLSAYVEAAQPWRVVEDSNSAVLERGEKTSSGWGPSGATWSHDPRIRRWRVVFTKGE